jgi:hypothetical protein
MAAFTSSSDTSPRPCQHFPKGTEHAMAIRLNDPPTQVNLHISLLQSIYCRSEWPRGLRHEPSSPAQSMGLWV